MISEFARFVAKSVWSLIRIYAVRPLTNQSENQSARDVIAPPNQYTLARSVTNLVIWGQNLKDQNANAAKSALTNAQWMCEMKGPFNIPKDVVSIHVVSYPGGGVGGSSTKIVPYGGAAGAPASSSELKKRKYEMDLYFTFKPLKFKNANYEIEGRPLTETEKAVSTAENCTSIWVYTDGVQIISVWRCRNLWARFLFLFTGKINCIELGNRPSAKSLTIGSPFK